MHSTGHLGCLGFRGRASKAFAPLRASQRAPRYRLRRKSVILLYLSTTLMIGCSRQSPQKPTHPDTNPSARPGLVSLSFPEPRMLVEDAWKPSWSPDGSRVVFCRPKGGGLGIYDLRSGTKRFLSEDGKDPDWSFDGRYIAFVRESSYNQYDTEEIWILDTADEKQRRLCRGGFPSWATDSRVVYFNSRARQDYRIMSLSVDEPEANAVVCSEKVSSRYGAVSPDGKFIAYGADRLFYIAEKRSGLSLLVWPTPGARGLLPAWSPDGRFVAFGGFDGDDFGVWVLDAASKEAVQVIAGLFTLPAWSKDGRRLAFDHREADDKRAVWAIDFSTVEQKFRTNKQ